MAKYDGERITHGRVVNYLLDKFPQYEAASTVDSYIIGVTPFLQSQYGDPGDGDCTLCSIMTWIYHYCGGKTNDQVIYAYVRKHAKDYFYNNTIGTIPFFAKTIFNKTLKSLKINRKINSYYCKGIGYTLGKIKNAIKKDIPVVFSVTTDGRNYYKSHTITIIGYETFRLQKQGLRDKDVTMLVVYDNWSKVYSYVDLDKVSVLSSIYF